MDGGNCGSCRVASKFSESNSELGEYDRDNFNLFEASLVLGEVTVYTNRTQTVGCIGKDFLPLLLKTAFGKVSCEPVPPDHVVLKMYPLFNKVKRLHTLGEPDTILADPDGAKIAVFVYQTQCYLVAPHEVIDVGVKK